MHDLKTLNQNREDAQTDKIKGKMQLDVYRNSNLSIDGYKFTRLLGDLLMCQNIDTETGEEVVRKGVIIPLGSLDKNQVWRMAKVMLAGPQASIKEGEIVVYPGDKGLTISEMGDLKNLVFLNEERIFGVVEALG